VEKQIDDVSLSTKAGKSMYEHQTTIRVRYAETDQMDVVYYGNYAQYFEVGRVEAMRAIGLSYKEIEKMGIHMPVVSMETKYIRPAYYDDLLTVKTTVPELPLEHQIKFITEVYNESGKLLTQGKVVLYFIDAATGKRATIPESLKEKLAPFFSEQ
jgi:acyl-CoA thioester hydrolase